MLNETWLAVKTTVTGRFRTQLYLEVRTRFSTDYRHIFRRLKSNFKCFFIGESHCVDWRSKWITTDHTLRTALVCCCKFLRQYMYFLRNLSRLSWPQWTLDAAKLSLNSRIFRTTVSFLSAQFRHKMFVKSEPLPRHCRIYISFPVINIQDSSRLWSFLGHPTSSIFV